MSRPAAPYRFLTACFVLLFLAGFGGSLPLPSNLDAISAVQLKRHLSFLASAELGGRYTLSAGNRIAARYLAAQLEAFGYRGRPPMAHFSRKFPL
ncbi:hypothetical protein [Chloracidobacterium thermophilum]|uniref:hypothetical protein n=1 Tax=Chloracidobacterium thermophilum TaxID=458033 RepID=UPI001BB2ED46|nr:hypothetical protein [Chloracidobacterium thermophilum]QUV78713.1 hypothetical protein J8C08_11685 [Chloracidobacterium thermophilum]